MLKTLTDDDFRAAAQALACEVAAVKAVCHVEAPRGGFNPDGSVTTLFERHKFYLYSKGRFAALYPNLCAPTPSRDAYGKSWKEEQARLAKAIELDRTAALMSASWGKFQIMGFNFGAAGFVSIEEFVAHMALSEGEQLAAFVNVVKAWGLDDELRDRRWADFARRYNGPGYAVNEYDVKLAAAYHDAASVMA